LSAFDLCVIGGGPAGLAAALAARQRGLTVLVADGAAPPIDKACGEGLMPDSLRELGRLGVEIPREKAFPFYGIRFVDGASRVEARFPSSVALGVRRIVLHQQMLACAERAGVSFRWKAAVRGIDSDGVRVGSEHVKARWIVGADGSRSLTRTWAGLSQQLYGTQRYAFRRHYRVRHWTNFMELHWGEGCQVYVTGVNDDEVCVALISRDPKLRLDEALKKFPEVADRLHGGEIASNERGAVTVTRKLARVCNDRVALIGDASGGVDAITGEGLCLAFHQAHALGACMERGDLRAYQQEHRKLARRPAMMGQLLLLLERQSRLRGHVIRAFGQKPSVFRKMVATHVGAASTFEMASAGLEISWGVFRSHANQLLHAEVLG
jgi:flavin-dependent dehydrogenase